MAAVLTVMGQDVSAYVTDWGEVEDIKEVLLASTQLFTGQVTLELSNFDGRFAPFRSNSLFYQKPYFQSNVTLYEDGELLFAGILKAVNVSKATRMATLTVENIFTAPTNQLATLVQAGVNPVVGALAVLTAGGLGSVTDTNSFLAAAAASSAAGAVVDVDFASKNTSILSAVQKLCELAAVSVFIRNGLITAQAVKPYQGNSAGLRFPLNEANVVDFGELQEAYDNLTNVVNVAYGASLLVTVRDPDSINRYQGYENEVKLSYAVGGAISIPDLASATYFGGVYLQRSSTLKYTFEINGADELKGIRIGDRHPVTEAYYGLAAKAFEVIQTHRPINKKTISLTLATLD